MPAFKLLCAEAGLSGELARWCCTKSQVAGVICITPRAPAEDVNPLLKALSCQARPAATDGGTAWAVATERISEAVVRWPVGCRGGGGAEGASAGRGGGRRGGGLGGAGRAANQYAWRLRGRGDHDRAAEHHLGVGGQAVIGRQR